MPALVLERVEGEALPPRLRRDPRYAHALEPLAGQCGEILARLHSIPLDRFPAHTARTRSSARREVLDGLDERHPAFELVLRRLELTRPEARHRTLVHGDFRLGNLLVDERGVSAVLDWELVHSGDPLEDLGWLCVPAWRFGGDAPGRGRRRLRDAARLLQRGRRRAVLATRSCSGGRRPAPCGGACSATCRPPATSRGTPARSSSRRSGAGRASRSGTRSRCSEHV